MSRWRSRLFMFNCLRLTQNAARVAVDAKRAAAALLAWRRACERALDFALLLAQGDAWARRQRLIPSVSRWVGGMAAFTLREVLYATAFETAQRQCRRRGLGRLRSEALRRAEAIAATSSLRARANTARVATAWRALRAGTSAAATRAEWWSRASESACRRFRSARVKPACLRWVAWLESHREHADTIAFAHEHWRCVASQRVVACLEARSEARRCGRAADARCAQAVLRVRGRVLMSR